MAEVLMGVIGEAVMLFPVGERVPPNFSSDVLIVVVYR